VRRKRRIAADCQERRRNVRVGLHSIGRLELLRELAVLLLQTRAELLERLRRIRRAAKRRHFIRVGADDHRYVVVLLFREQRADLIGKHPAIDVLLRPDHRGEDALDRQRAQRRGTIGADVLREREADSFGRLLRSAIFGEMRRTAETAAALADRANEESLGERRSHQRVDAPRSCGFAADRHARWIAAKRRDVPLHPLQRRNLIEHAVVAGRLVW
jgi:hypothetical protein